MLKKIRDNWFWSVVLGAYLTWMGFVSFAAYTSMSNDKMNGILHNRISNTKDEITLETNAKVLDLKKELFDLRQENRELRNMILNFLAK